MYEDQTFETILNRMLDRVPEDVDKREGSIIYDALAPAASELAQAYIELDINTSLSFALTSSGEYLERRTAEVGITRRPATKASRKGLFYDNDGQPVVVPIGSRYSISNVNFAVTEQLAVGEYALECEVEGEVGNMYMGALLPIDYVDGLARAELNDILLAGEDEESDETIRQRYLQRVQTPSAGGNKADYLNWALEVTGVGAAKIYDLWNGNGTVKVVITDSDKLPAKAELEQSVLDHIESVRPIGANVTVVSAVAKGIDVASTVTLAPGYSLQTVTDSFKESMTAYFRDLVFTSDYVSLAKIGTLLLAVPGVLDYGNLTVNGGTSNLPLADEEIPVTGIVTLEV